MPGAVYTGYVHILRVHVCALINMAFEGAEYIFKQQNRDILDGPHFSLMAKA